MPRCDKVLAYAEGHRLVVCAVAALLLCAVGGLDWQLPTISVGFLYLIPVLLCAAALNGLQIVALAILCAYLREAFDPLQGPSMLNPLHWSPGASGRVTVVSIGFAMTGFFISELNQRRRLLTAHIRERE